MMRQIITTLPLIGVILWSCQNLEAQEVFEISKVGKDKSTLLKYFSVIEEKENKARKPHSLLLEVAQKQDDKNYHVYLYNIHTRSQTRYLLKLLDSKSYADNEKIIVYAKSVEGTSEYRTITGANANIRILQEFIPEQPILFSQEEFVKRLKDGETWDLKGALNVPCAPCFGDGKKSNLQGGEKCMDCNGKGFLIKDVIVKW